MSVRISELFGLPYGCLHCMPQLDDHLPFCCKFSWPSGYDVVRVKFWRPLPTTEQLHKYVYSNRKLKSACVEPDFFCLVPWNRNKIIHKYTRRTKVDEKRIHKAICTGSHLQFCQKKVAMNGWADMSKIYCLMYVQNSWRGYDGRMRKNEKS